MTDPSSTAVPNDEKSSLLSRALLVIALIAIALTIFWIIQITHKDPFIQSALSLKGSEENGEQLFRINCAGCHGIAAEGLLGPSLQGVGNHLNDAEIVNQIIQGKTPPMPSFQMEPETMADILAHLHSL